jgi:hypothetical protein
MAADRRLFTEHPGAQRYLRPIQRDEIAEMRLAGVVPEGWSAAGDVEITELKPGVRAPPVRLLLDVSGGAIRVIPPGSAVPVRFAELADQALASGEVVIGGGVIPVPDLVLLEGAAHELPIPETFKLLRDDGRSVAFYKWPGGAA